MPLGIVEFIPVSILENYFSLHYWIAAHQTCRSLLTPVVLGTNSTLLLIGGCYFEQILGFPENTNFITGWGVFVCLRSIPIFMFEKSYIKVFTDWKSSHNVQYMTTWQHLTNHRSKSSSSPPPLPHALHLNNLLFTINHGSHLSEICVKVWENGPKEKVVWNCKSQREHWEGHPRFYPCHYFRLW